MKARVYLKGFANWPDVISQFDARFLAPTPKYVFAVYARDGYEGSALVIYSVDGRKFNVVEGSHCSCFGLEQQWSPTIHGRRDLKRMMTATYGLWSEYAPEIKNWLETAR